MTHSHLYLRPQVSTRTYVYTFWKQIEIFWNEFQSRFQKLPFMPPPEGIHMWYVWLLLFFVA